MPAFSCAPTTAAHTLELRAKSIDYEIRETFESALAFGAETLRGLGLAADEADTIVEEVRRRDAERLEAQLGGDTASGVEATRPSDVTPEPLTLPARREGATGTRPPRNDQHVSLGRGRRAG